VALWCEIVSIATISPDRTVSARSIGNSPQTTDSGREPR
jgi:hypothetical protein